MIQRGFIRRAALVVVGVFALALAVLPSRAFAGPSVQIEKNTLDETEAGWKLKFVIDLGAVPDINFVPMDFLFTPKTYYERTCDDDHDKPYLNKKPITNGTLISVPQTVGFSDGSGKTYNSTKFNFTIKRDDRFEAGEYQLEVRRDGKTIGSKMTVTLNGNNKIVNRKAMVFSGDKTKKSADPCDDQSVGVAPAKADIPPPSDPPPGDSSGTTSGSGEPAATTSGGEDTGATSGDPAGTVPPKQGGCGCFVSTEGDVAGAGLFALAGLGVLVSRRRRR